MIKNLFLKNNKILSQRDNEKTLFLKIIVKNHSKRIIKSLFLIKLLF